MKRTDLERPCYVYRGEELDAQCNLLKEVFAGATILYSIKANPFPPVVARLAANGIGSDSASLREVELSAASGMRAEDIYYSSMGKDDADILGSMDGCTIIADSLGELRRIDRLAEGRQTPLKVGVRLNPTFAWDGGPGTASKFGVDQEQLLAAGELLKGLRNITLCGLHVHLHSQVLDEGVLSRYYQNVYEAACEIGERLGVKIEFLNFGGGVGMPYSAEERPLDMAALRAAFAGLVARNREGLGARLLVESGRFLVCRAGVYLTDIVDIKTSQGRKYLVVKAGLNGFLRPAMKELFRGVAPEGFTAEPFFTGPDAFSYAIENGETETERVDVVGCLCTALDVLASDVELPKARVGDTIVISNAGAYARTLSPLLFSSHEPPKEYLI